jgi:predicted kinase
MATATAVSVRSRVLASAAALGLAAASWGCSAPCDALAESVCARTGPEAALCSALQAHASSPTIQDVRSCQAGVAFAHELGRAR